jgi:hypothetical protein
MIETLSSVTQHYPFQSQKSVLQRYVWYILYIHTLAYLLNLKLMSIGQYTIFQKLNVTGDSYEICTEKIYKCTVIRERHKKEYIIY